MFKHVKLTTDLFCSLFRQYKRLYFKMFSIKVKKKKKKYPFIINSIKAHNNKKEEPLVTEITQI